MWGGTPPYGAGIRSCRIPFLPHKKGQGLAVLKTFKKFRI